MRRLTTLSVTTPILILGLMHAPPATAATTWNFADGSFSISDGYGATAAIAVRNLVVPVGGQARGYVRVALDRYVCSTQTFTGSNAQFFPSGSEPCSGNIAFDVDPQSGSLSVSVALTITSRVFAGPATGSSQGVAQKPTVGQLQGCTAVLDDTMQAVRFDMSGSHPDAVSYRLDVLGSNPLTQTFTPAELPLEQIVDYSFLQPGETVAARVTGSNSSGDPVATCTTNDVVVPWSAPGKPAIDGPALGVAGGQVTINFTVANPRTVQGIEYRIDANSWLRPGGTAPTGGVGGSFGVTGLSVGSHTIELRSVGFGPTPKTTLGDRATFNIPAPPSKPTSGSRPSQPTNIAVIGGAPAAPTALPPAKPVSYVPGTSNGAGIGTNGALAATSGDAGVDAPCLAPDGILYPPQYSTVGSQHSMAPNTRGFAQPESFTVISGALAPGLQLDRTFGILFGVTTKAGAWVTTIQATFADGSKKVTQFTTRVDADPETLQYSAQNIAYVGSRIAIPATTNAPPGASTFTLVCGQLPVGTGLDARTGLITGIPTSVVELPTPLRVAETSPTGRASASFIFVVKEAGTALVSYPSHPHSRVGKRIAIRPTVIGVGEIALFRMWKGKLPKGLHLNRKTGVITGRSLHAGKPHAITIVAVTRGGALLTATPLTITVRK